MRGGKPARGTCRVGHPGGAISLGSVAGALGDARPYKSRANHGDADSERPSLQRQSLRHRDHGIFAGRVRAQSQPCLEPGHRRHVDEVTTLAMTCDMRQERTNAMEHAHHVDVHDPSPCVERDVVDAASTGDTGIVADHMDGAEGVERRRRRAFDAERIGNVAGSAPHVRSPLPQALDGCRQCRRIDVGQHDFHAGLEKGTADGKTDTAGAAGDERRFAGKIAHDLSSTFGAAGSDRESRRREISRSAH